MLFAHFQNCSVEERKRKTPENKKVAEHSEFDILEHVFGLAAHFNVECVIYYDGMVGRLYQP